MRFRGASADAFAAVTEELETVVSGSGDVAQLGDDLFAVAQTLRGEPRLRRVATDVSVPADAKSGLVSQLLSGKIGDGALSIVVKAVGRRWTAGRDLADALEQLGVVALVKSSSEPGRLADELFGFSQVVKDNPELRDALSDSKRSNDDKRTLVHGLLDGKALPATVRLVEQALVGAHRTVGVALREYQQVAADAHGQGVATVHVARPLSDSDRERLARALTQQYGRPVHLNVVVSPDLIGGMRVEIGNDVIDGTVSGRLADARRKLAG